MRPTLVAISHREINGRLFHHGSEIPEGLISGDLLDQWLDKGWAREMPERRSLYRLFATFSGCTEREHLGAGEVTLT